MTDDFIGPRKPAFLTVSIDRLDARYPDISQSIRDVFRRQCQQTEEGIVAVTVETGRNPRLPNGEVHVFVRLTFIDDTHAAEFALRYA